MKKASSQNIQPPPTKNGIEVAPLLKEFICDSDCTETDKVCLCELIDERTKVGISKYKQPLYTEDGRDTIVDAKQELGDLLQYWYKAILLGKVEEANKELGPGLFMLLHLFHNSKKITKVTFSTTWNTLIHRETRKEKKYKKRKEKRIINK